MGANSKLKLSENRLTAKWLCETFGMNAKHCLYREDGIWYHHLERFPGILFDANGYLIVNTKEEYESNPSFRRTKALTIKKAISNLDSYIPFSDEQLKIILIEDFLGNDVTEEQTIRRLRHSEIIVRNRSLVAKIKELYSNSCQLCNNQLKIRKSIFYSEVHHIIPLGAPHNGKDNLSNVLCVCPNCHVLLDLGAIKLETIPVSKHKISKESLAYHNITIWNSNLIREKNELRVKD